MYYIFNKDGFCFCTCDYEPNLDDLASREETLIKSNKIYDASKIKLENGVIVAITPNLDELKVQKLTELKATRDNEEVKPISYQGYHFDYDSKARDRINAAIIALDVSKGQIAWTTADNTEVMVNADDLRGVIAAVAMRSNKLHNAYRTAKEKVLEATTKEEVEKVVLNSGQ